MKPTPSPERCVHGLKGTVRLSLRERPGDAWPVPPNNGDDTQQSFALKEPLELFATVSPFQTRRDLSMHRRSVDSPNSPGYRQMVERTSSRDPTTPMSAVTQFVGGFSAQTTDPASRPSRQRARSNSTPDKRLSAPGHTVVTSVDHKKYQDRNTWSAGSAPAIVQRSPSTLQRSPSTAGRNQSQTNLLLHRSPSNSPTTPAHIQRTPSNLSTYIPSTLSRRFSKSSQHSPAPIRPRPILFYHKHEPHYGFTNFSNHTVMYDNKIYPTSEHLFQSLKVCNPLVGLRII